MNETNLKNKKIFAREIIIFFVSIAFISLIWLFLVIRNNIYEHKLQTSKLDFLKLDVELYDLSSVAFQELYNKVSPRFKNEKLESFENNSNPKTLTGYHFIKNEHKFNYLEAVKVGLTPNTVNQYLNEKKYYFPFDIIKLKKNGVTDKEVDFLLNQDSLVLFDSVAFEKFCDLLKNEKYKNLIFKTFSNDLFTLTKISFDSIIEKNLNYVEKVKLKKQNLINQELDEEKIYDNSKNCIIEKNVIINFIMYASLLIALIIYPLRLIYYLIKWAIKVLKQPN